MKNSNIYIGVLLLTIGIFAFLKSLNIILFSFELLWPLLLFISGIAFEISYFKEKNNHFALMPGAILTLYGIFFYLNTLTSVSLITKGWPIIPMAIGFGFLQIYFFANKNKFYFKNGIIVTSISILLLLISIFELNFNEIIPVILVVTGIYILYKHKFKN